jgi:hypothetical protein
MVVVVLELFWQSTSVLMKEKRTVSGGRKDSRSRSTTTVNNNTR